MDAKALIERSKRAWTRRETFLDLLREAYRYAMPERNPLDNVAQGGRKRELEVFDSTAIVATARFANRIQTVLCPPQRVWAKIEPGTEIPPEQRDAAAKACQALTAKVFAAIRASNFDASFNELAHDLALGTGVMLIEKGRSVKRPGAPLLRFTAVPTGLVAIDEGPFGQVEGVFHKRKVSARNLMSAYPDGTMPDGMRDHVANKPDDDVEVLQATVFDEDAGDWKFVALLEHLGEEGVIVRRSHRTSPWVVVRWLKAPGEVDGRGPVLQALPDIRTASKVVELILKNATLAVSGVYMAADDGVVNPSTIVLRPGTFIPVARTGGTQGASLAPLPRAGDFNVAQLVLDDMRASIKSVLLDRSLPPDSGPVRSATEIVERQKELQQEIGAAFGRLVSDGTTQIILRCMDILEEQGVIQRPLKLDGRELALTPVSPLARAQALEEVQTVADAMSLLAALGPEALQMGLDMQEVPAWIATQLGVPEELVPDRAAREAMVSERKQAEEMDLMARSPAVSQVVKAVVEPAGGVA
jgi:hypothetical protein